MGWGGRRSEFGLMLPSSLSQGQNFCKTKTGGEKEKFREETEFGSKSVPVATGEVGLCQ